MALGQLKGIGIKGVVCALPDNKKMTVDYTDKFEKEVLERVVDQTGVRSTYRTKEKQTASDLCYEAAERLIEELKWEKESIGALVFVTLAQDYKRPANGGVLQKRLNLSKETMVLDIKLGCSGYVYGLSVIGSFMQTSDTKRALLLCGDLSSKAVDPNVTSSLLFADIGSATALEISEGCPDIHYLLGADGSGYKSIFARGGEFRHPESKEVYVGMSGMDVFTFSITEVPKAIKNFISQYGIDLEQIDLFALHQANELIIKQIAKKCKFPMEKTPIVLREYGNSSSSSIPLVITTSLEHNRDKDTHILMSGFGIGLSWGVADMVLAPDAVIDIFATNHYYDDDNDCTVSE
ncbi:MAG: ketoacyl-ACP synthase III [Roseburia sp.]|nr:ketoacyl-ACP synthase III [Roseburia sp.]